MKIANVNVSFKGRVHLGDECEYRADATNPKHTAFEQQAFLELPSFPFSSTCEKFMTNSYEKNTGKGRNIDKAFIQDAIEDGWFEKHGIEKPPLHSE